MGNFHTVQTRQQRPYHSMSTNEILADIGNECKQTLATIEQIRRDRDVDCREYFCQLMKDLEKKICYFNEDMVGKSQIPERRQPDFDITQSLKQEVNRLKGGIDALNNENRSLEKLLRDEHSKSQRGERSVSTKKAVENEPRKADIKANSIGAGIGQRNDNQVVKDLQDQLVKRDDEITTLEAFIKHLSETIDELKKENKKLSDDNEKLILRLSKIAGERLVMDNPGIADLSDPNRPTRLGEFYSELYDNEWTDAFEAITKAGHNENDAIVTLRLTLINVLEFCRIKSDTLLKKTEDAVNFLFEEFQNFEEQKKKHLKITRSQSKQWLKEAKDSSFDGLPDELIDLQERWRPKEGGQIQMKRHDSVEVLKPDVVVKQLKVFRKEVAESMVPIVQKAYMSASWKDEVFISQLKPFIKKCIFLGWLMVVQSPPMALATCEEGEPFDKNMFKEYTKSGPKVEFVVWPALLLNENGPIIGKGVAEGRKAKAKQA